ncbi:amino acid ABC transporter substrate-binding protein [Alicyclobacillaceae bacterium I2511]|nr:amino acid ABC transporter substrate-binding protein [Alicyclobacillaceae bacterium I2511]
MNSKKMKGVTGTLVALLVLGGVAGCAAFGGSNGQSNSAAIGSPSTGNTDVLQKVMSTRTLTVGCILSFPPFGLESPNGQPEGYDVDMAKALAKSLNVPPQNLHIMDVTAQARIPDLQTGKVDVVIGNFTQTTARWQSVDFTNPYVVAGERLIVKKGSGINKLSDLNGKTVGVTTGSTDDQIVKQVAPGAKVHYFNTSADAIQGVKSGIVDAFIEDSNFLQYQAKMNPSLEVVGGSLVPLEYNSFGIKKGDQNWLNYLNFFIFDMNSSGENAALYKKWFGVYPPYPVNPTMPMVSSLAPTS